MSRERVTFASVCSGIEAASVAWQPLGWRCAWLAEIEPFPCAVLAHHYPDDYTRIPWHLGYWEPARHAPEVIAAIRAKCPDGPRYKALGNSMAVPVMRWIGQRTAAALHAAKEGRPCGR